jgi:D-ribulokinase
MDVYAFLNRLVGKIKGKQGLSVFSKLHMLPYHHGNRSPRADPLARGLISGLTLQSTLEEVALWYAATIQAIAYGTRHIIEAMNKKGYNIEQIYLSGGHLKNSLFIQEHADITGCRVIIPKEPEAVLLGTAMLGAVAAGEYPDLVSAMWSMCKIDKVFAPNPKTFHIHGERYSIFKKMYRFQKQIHKQMESITQKQGKTL